MPSGGKREGAGRPVGTGQYGEPTVTMRIPVSQVDTVQRYLKLVAEVKCTEADAENTLNSITERFCRLWVNYQREEWRMNKPTDKDYAAAEEALEKVRYGIHKGWHKEFKDVLAQLIADRVVEGVKEAMQKLLDEGHGGGNWRRVAMQIMDEAKKEGQE